MSNEVAHAQKAHKGKGRSRLKRAEEEFEILDITDGPEGYSFTIVPVEVVKIDEALKPHPSYEACTPLMQSPHLKLFMPFSDDPEFNYKYVVQRTTQVFLVTNTYPITTQTAHISFTYIDDQRTLIFYYRNRSYYC